MFKKEFPIITSTVKHVNISNKTVSKYLNNNKFYTGYIFITNLKDN